ncbi:MAG: VOC family protein [bacterium]
MPFANKFFKRILITDNYEGLEPFYTRVFPSWDFAVQPVSAGRQWATIDPGIGPGGMVMSPAKLEPHGWLPYVLVESIHNTILTAMANGGTVVVPERELPGGGTFAIIADPDENRIGIYQERE